MIADQQIVNQNAHRSVHKRHNNNNKSNSLFFEEVSSNSIENVQSLIITHTEINKNEQCRICLQNRQQSSLQLCCPCSCVGSLKYVHGKCIKQWIKAVLLSKHEGRYFQEIIEEGLQCQLCKTKMFFDIDYEYRRGNCQQINQNIQQKKISFVIVLILLCLALGVIIFSIVKFTQISTINVPIIILLVIGLIIMTAFLIFSLYFLVNNFFSALEIEIGELRKNISGKRVLIFS